MLDYEIRCFKVQYTPKGAVCRFEHITDTEESAVEFIKSNRADWVEYRMVKLQVAIIDF